MEFYRTSQDSGVLPEVYISLLPSQSSMELSVYPTEQIERHAGHRGISHMKYTRCSSFPTLRF